MTEMAQVDQNGHLFWDRDIDLTTYRLLTRHKDDTPLPLRTMLGIGHHGCSYCGVRPELVIDEPQGGAAVVKAVDPCPAVDGVKTTFQLNVPSGKIVVSDDLRDVYNVPDEVEDSFHSYNTDLGQHEYQMYMASIGCAYGPVGNTCPGIYKREDGSYTIASPSWDPVTDDMTEFPGEHVGGIVTDLWAYSIADHDDFVAKGGDPTQYDVIEVEPGTYEFVHHTGERGFDRDAVGVPIIFADFRKVDS